MLLLSVLILLLVIVFAAYVMKWRAEAFSDFGSPAGPTTLLLSKVPDVCSDLGTKTDCTMNSANGCMWSAATGMCMKAPPTEGFQTVDCSKITDCNTCAAEGGCGWCKVTGKCLTTDRFGFSAGRCNPESEFATFPSDCTDVNFGPDAGTLLSGSSGSSVGATELIDSSTNRAMCRNLLDRAQPNVTNPDLRRQVNDLRAQCTTLLNKVASTASASTASASASAPASTAPASTAPASSAEIQVQFRYDEIPTFSERLRSDIQRLMQTIGI
jgi:hypothetical protein